ncbi:hypothetical protein AUP68_07298 [Ilyonectria robusta]
MEAGEDAPWVFHIYAFLDCQQIVDGDNVGQDDSPWFETSCQTNEGGQCQTVPYSIKSFAINSAVDYNDQHGQCEAWAYKGGAAKGELSPQGLPAERQSAEIATKTLTGVTFDTPELVGKPIPSGDPKSRGPDVIAVQDPPPGVPWLSCYPYAVDFRPERLLTEADNPASPRTKSKTNSEKEESKPVSLAKVCFCVQRMVQQNGGVSRTTQTETRISAPPSI